MQDRFKVRVWNTLVKEFSYFDKPEMQIGTDGFDNGLIFPLSENSNLYIGKYSELQFCTGLKDKNGKLIYEGDIVKLFNDEFCNIHTVKFGDFAMYSLDFQTEYEEGSTAVYGWYLGGLTYPIPLSISLDTSGLELEVIGNIYETPELLSEVE